MFRFIKSPCLFPPTVRHVSATFHPDLWSAVRPDEAEACRSLLERAVPRRRSEFVAGRRCAARALEPYLARDAGGTGIIGRRPDRSPIWPAGLVGSITHTECYAAAAVSGSMRGVGLDSELLLRDEQAAEIAAAVGSDQEIRRAATEFSACDRLGLTVLFSAKESLFKCLFPVACVWFDFRQARLVDADAGRGSVTLELTSALTGEFAAGWRAVGSVRLDLPYVHTGFLLDRQTGRPRAGTP
jgi:enterobactin synthetase component D